MNSYNIEELNTYTKAQLIEIITNLHNRLTAPRSNKKFDVLQILRTNKALSISQIAEKLNISTKNVSSLLSYLRKDGFILHRDHTGCVYLVDQNQQIDPELTKTTEQTE